MFKYTDKQQLLTLHIQCNSVIDRGTFITSGKETVLYIKGMLVKLNHR